jgi:O-succinylbenzoic acid--CoA ligase
VEAAATARRLAALGAGAGDRVATTLPAGMAFAALLHALPRLGAVLVPLSTRLTDAERRWQVEDSGARLVVEEPLDGPESEVALFTQVGAADPQTVVYTSGTTGTPKRVVLTYGNHRASALASAWRLGVAPDDRWLCVLPVFHVGGLAILLRSALYGNAAVVHDGFDPDAARDSIERGEATLVSLVSTMLRRLIRTGLGGWPALRAALLGGGPIPEDLVVWAGKAGFPLVASYGMTETASQVVTGDGEPLPGVELSIAADGEILVRGPMVAPGTLADDGWLHTGDRGRLEEGRLRVEGRLSDVIVTGGENVMAAEVERALLEHPGVREAAVVGIPDPEWGEAVAAFVVGSAGEEELAAHCRERMAAYKCPKRVHLVDELPRTPAGKVMRGALRARVLRP